VTSLKLKHHSRLHYNKTVSWLRLTEAQETLAQAAQNDEVGDHGVEEDDSDSSADFSLTAGKWLCTHCLDRPCEKRPRHLLNLKMHLKSQCVFRPIFVASRPLIFAFCGLRRHQVEEPELNRDYHRGFDPPDTNEIGSGYEDLVVIIPLARPKKKPVTTGFSLSDFAIAMF
jgi:hypothetical protein